MVKTLLFGLSVGALAGLGACSTDNSTPLDQLSKTFGETHLEIVADQQVKLLLHIDGDGCATLSDDVVATYDGVQMEMSNGGYAEDAFGCYPIAFWIKDFKPLAIGARERSVGSSDIVIRDATSSWKVAPTQLFGNDLEIDAATSSIVRPNVDHIASVRIVPTVDYQIENNSIKYTAGTQITFAQAYAHPIPTLCAGPGSCSVDLQRTRDFSTTLPK